MQAGRRPHLLVQAGDSKTACIYVGSYPWKPSFASVEQSTEMSYNCLETFSDADPTWAAWVVPWVTQPPPTATPNGSPRIRPSER